MSRALRLVLAGAVIVALAALLSREALTTALLRISRLPWYGALSLLSLQCISLILLGAQWTRLLRTAAPRATVTWRKVMPRYLAGSFVESVTPSARGRL